MTNLQLYAKIDEDFKVYRNQYDWLDETIDNVLWILNEILEAAPTDDFFAQFMTFIICEDHHDGFICEALLGYDYLDNELSVQIDEYGFSLSLNNSHDFYELLIVDEISDENLQKLYSIITEKKEEFLSTN